jgi:hypothetical protein
MHLNLNRLEGPNIWCKAQTMNAIQDMRLTKTNFYLQRIQDNREINSYVALRMVPKVQYLG